MAYTKTEWIDKDDPAFNALTDPRINATNLNKIEQGIFDKNESSSNLKIISDTGTLESGNVILRATLDDVPQAQTQECFLLYSNQEGDLTTNSRMVINGTYFGLAYRGDTSIVDFFKMRTLYITHPTKYAPYKYDIVPFIDVEHKDKITHDSSPVANSIILDLGYLNVNISDSTNPIINTQIIFKVTYSNTSANVLLRCILGGSYTGGNQHSVYLMDGSVVPIGYLNANNIYLGYFTGTSWKVSKVGGDCTGGTSSDISTDTTNFDNNLSEEDDTVAKALNTIDNLVIGSGKYYINTEDTSTDQGCIHLAITEITALGASEDNLSIIFNPILENVTNVYAEARMYINSLTGVDIKYLGSTVPYRFLQPECKYICTYKYDSGIPANSYFEIFSIGGAVINTTNFNKNLSENDDTVQKALETLDNLIIPEEYSPTYLLHKVSGTTGEAEGDSVNIAHGRTQADILGIRAVCEGVPQNSDIVGKSYSIEYGITNIVVTNHSTNSENILSKSISILIDWEEGE